MNPNPLTGFPAAGFYFVVGAFIHTVFRNFCGERPTSLSHLNFVPVLGIEKLPTFWNTKSNVSAAGKLAANRSCFPARERGQPQL
jgi:hypothetical protein